MNKVILMGRLTRDPEIKTHGNTTVGKITLAVDRKFKQDGQPSADFINCIAFGKLAEFQEKYCKKGIKLIITGRIQTGSYTNKDGKTIYTSDIVIEEQEFAESKGSSSSSSSTESKPESKPSSGPALSDGFMSIPDGIDESLPFC